MGSPEDYITYLQDKFSLLLTQFASSMQMALAEAGRE